MSKRYPGNFITGNPVALSQTSNNGIWDVKDVSAAVGAGNWQEPDGIYEINKSLRFRRSGSAYLSRTPSVAGNRSTWTWSAWVKRGAYSADMSLFGWDARAISNGYSGYFWFYNDNTLEFGEGASRYRITKPVYRDTSSWYHIMLVLDTTQSNDSSRARIYVNGIEADYATSLTITQNTSLQCNNTYPHSIGADYPSTGARNMFDGYITEVNFIDGQALDPSYFGYLHPVTNIWQPKKYTGSYGFNGCYLPFSDNSCLNSLGTNFAGTNLFSYSTNFNSYWSNNYNTIASTTITAPDGSSTATWVKEANAGSAQQHLIFTSITGSTPATTDTFNFSAYFKTDGSNRRVFLTTHGGNYPTFNLQTGKIEQQQTAPGVQQYQPGQAYEAKMEFVGNGWYRCSIFGNVQAANTAVYMGTIDESGNWNHNGDTSKGYYVWGAQFSYGKQLLPYTATSGTAIPGWTTSNISLTAGTTYDSMADSPTNVFTSVTDTGGVVPGNYATWNTLVAGNYNNVGGVGPTIISFTEGALRADNSAQSGYAPRMQCWSTIGMTSGKWYAEFTNMSNMNCGISKGPITTGTGNGIDSTVHYGDGGSFSAVNGASGTQFGTPLSCTTSDVIGVAFDADVGTITFYKNNVSMGGFTSLTTTGIYEASRPWFFSRSPGSSGSPASMTANFGQRPFAYTPPTGFKSLNTTNIQALGTAGVSNAAIKANQWFDINSYVGTGTANNVINPSGMGPDLVIVKSTTSAGYNIAVADTVRGAPATLFLDLMQAEQSDSGYWLSTINSNGFSTAGSGGSATSYASTDYTAWQWKQSPTSGFNIVTYTGNGVDNREITHNLGVTPKVCLIHARNDGSSRSWPMFTFLTTQSTGNVFTSSTFNVGSKSGGVLSANLTAAAGTYGMDGQTNANGTSYVAYLWAEVPGFSKMGVYYANNTDDGPIIWTGFTPKFVLVRSTSASRDWLLWDRNRRPYNGFLATSVRAGAQSFTSAAAYAAAGYYGDGIDFLSTGFKFRNAGSPNYNSGSETYFYMAFAEAPFALNNRAI